MLECESSNGRMFIRISAPWFPTYRYYPCFGIWLYLIALTTVYCGMFVQPLFRYFLIVRNTTLTSTKTWMLHFLTIFTAALLSAEYSSSYCRNEEDLTFNSILSNINPWKFEESLNSFRSRDLVKPRFPC
uniref:Uncharacterized protein n=1 Tax=Panagrolaimus davidi TaxID=227884 RepID=A0A914PB90_9BILA